MRLFGISAYHALLYCTVVFCFGILFISFPNIDIAVSALFGDATGFPLSESSILNTIRGVMLFLTDGVMIVVLALLIAALIFRKIQIINRRILAFAVTSYIVGPGLIVNAFLKAYSGRARPRQIDVFGGDKSFSPAFIFTDQCEKNCSFVSGEASALATVAVIATLVLVRRLPKAKRVAASVAIAAFAAFGSSLRIVFGAHFLSDVVFAWFISIAVVMVLHAMFNIRSQSTEVPAGRTRPKQRNTTSERIRT